MSAAERSVIAESLLDLNAHTPPARFSGGALIAAPAPPPARGSNVKKAMHPKLHYLDKSSA